MFRTSGLRRQFSCPTLKSSSLHPNCGSQRRAGLAFVEVILIVLIPSFCLFFWTLFDSELKQSLLAGVNKDGILTANPVYDAVNMGDDTILTVQSQGQMRVWDLKKSVMRGEIQSHLDEIRCAAYSASQRLIAVGSAMGKLEIWNLDHPDSPVVADDASLKEISDCQFSEDGTVLLTACEDGKLVIWDTRTLVPMDTLVSADTQGSIRSLDISSDDKYVAAGTCSGIVEIWDLGHRKLVHSHRVTLQEQRCDAAVERVNFLADNRTFICATRNDGVAIRDIETGVCLQQMEGRFSNLRSGALSPDQSHFIAGNTHGWIVSWNLTTGSRTDIFIPNSTIVRSVACSTDGRILLSGDLNGNVKFHQEPNRVAVSQIAQR